MDPMKKLEQEMKELRALIEGKPGALHCSLRITSEGFTAKFNDDSFLSWTPYSKDKPHLTRPYYSVNAKGVPPQKLDLVASRLEAEGYKKDAFCVRKRSFEDKVLREAEKLGLTNPEYEE